MYVYMHMPHSKWLALIRSRQSLSLFLSLCSKLSSTVSKVYVYMIDREASLCLMHERGRSKEEARGSIFRSPFPPQARNTLHIQFAITTMIMTINESPMYVGSNRNAFFFARSTVLKDRHKAAQLASGHVWTGGEIFDPIPRDRGWSRVRFPFRDQSLKCRDGAHVSWALVEIFLIVGNIAVNSRIISSE